jgi:zinc D-Ala-D-Ala carboxypeptidase
VFRSIALPLLGAGVLTILGICSNGIGGAGQAVDGKRGPASGSNESALVRLSSAEAATASRVSAVFEKAAIQNGILQSQMSWLFGGKAQRGWQLYGPLISALIGTENETSSGSFAVRLSRWQADNGLSPSGVLDEKTWMAMIAVLQSGRIRDRSLPSADMLVTAPASDFYDPTREDELRRIERRTYAAYQRLIEAAVSDPSLGLSKAGTRRLAPDEKFFKIISAHRTPEYQDRLRQRSPKSGRAGLAVNSPHFTGRALDLYVGGEPVSTRDENRAIQVNSRAYRWLVKNAARFGFRPYFYEPWHWEYVSD